jgi:hypothetical protein
MIRWNKEYTAHDRRWERAEDLRCVQQGDCNVGATYQGLMNHLFAEYIGVFMFVYLDDIIIFSNSIEEHVEHMRTVFKVLEREKFYWGLCTSAGSGAQPSLDRRPGGHSSLGRTPLGAVTCYRLPREQSTTPRDLVFARFRSAFSPAHHPCCRMPRQDCIAMK